MSKRVLLVGAFHEIIELCEECGLLVAGIFDREQRGSYMGIPILGNDDEAVEHAEQYRDVPVIVSPDTPAVRRTLVQKYREAGYSFASVVSPRAFISRTAELGVGVCIQSGCRVSAMSRIGDFVRMNVGAHVTHDVHVGQFTTIAPEALVLGDVRIGEESYIGAHSTILPHRVIGDRAVVGAGAVVTKDVAPEETVVGNPARKLER